MHLEGSLASLLYEMNYMGYFTMDGFLAAARRAAVFENAEGTLAASMRRIGAFEVVVCVAFPLLRLLAPLVIFPLLMAPAG